MLYYVLDTRHLPGKDLFPFNLVGWVVSEHRSHEAAEKANRKRAEGAPEGSFIVFEAPQRFNPGAFISYDEGNRWYSQYALGSYTTRQIRENYPPDEAERIISQEDRHQRKRIPMRKRKD